MTRIAITTHTSGHDLLRHTNIAVARYNGRWRILAVLLTAIFAGAAAGCAIGWVFGVPFNKALIITIYTEIGAAVCGGIANRLLQRRHGVSLQQSPLRNRGNSYTLSETGVDFMPRQVEWAAIRDVRREKAATIIMFSDIDILVLPDADVPAGQTPETLLAQINQWRGKA